MYAVVADFVTQEKIDRLEQFRKDMESTYRSSRKQDKPSLAGLVYTPHLQRSYPEKDLGSNILGFVSREGLGYFGVKSKFNQLLAGTPQTVWMPRDPNRVEETPIVSSGASLILTLTVPSRLRWKILLMMQWISMAPTLARSW